MSSANSERNVNRPLALPCSSPPTALVSICDATSERRNALFYLTDPAKCALMQQLG
jgi:hypothetical protein